MHETIRCRRCLRKKKQKEEEERFKLARTQKKKKAFISHAALMVTWRRAIELSNFFKESHLFGRHLARNGNWTGDSYTALNSASFCSYSLQLKRRIVISVTLRGQTRRFWGGKETLIRASAVAFSNHGYIEVTGLLGPSVFSLLPFFLSSYPPPTPPRKQPLLLQISSEM